MDEGEEEEHMKPLAGQSGPLSSFKPIVNPHIPLPTYQSAAAMSQLSLRVPLSEPFSNRTQTMSLKTAATYGHIEIVRQYLFNPHNKIKNAEKKIAFEQAAYNNHTDIVSLFLSLEEKDKDVASDDNDAEYKTQLDRSAALNVAVRRGNIPVVQLFLGGACPELLESGVITCFQIAFEYGHAELISMLFEMFPNSYRDVQKDLEYAAFYPHRIGIIRTILRLFPDVNKNMAMIHAASNADTNIVTLLIERGAKLHEAIRQTIGNLPLYLKAIVFLLDFAMEDLQKKPDERRAVFRVILDPLHGSRGQSPLDPLHGLHRQRWKMFAKQMIRWLLRFPYLIEETCADEELNALAQQVLLGRERDVVYHVGLVLPSSSLASVVLNKIVARQTQVYYHVLQRKNKARWPQSPYF